MVQVRKDFIQQQNLWIAGAIAVPARVPLIVLIPGADSTKARAVRPPIEQIRH